MNALKYIVIGMGVLIIVGMVGVGVGIYQKTASPPMVDENPSPPVEGGAVSAPFGDVAVAIGEGCAITEMAPAGGRLYLSVGPDGPCRKIIVIDVAKGRVLGALKVTP